MTDLLITVLLLVVVAWIVWKFLPYPIGLIGAIVIGLVILIKYLLPLLK